jgi:hypothetical protein
MDNPDLLDHLELLELLDFQDLAARMEPLARLATLEHQEPLDKLDRLASLALTALLVEADPATREHLEDLACPAAQDNPEPTVTMVLLEDLDNLDRAHMVAVPLAILVPLAHLAMLVNLAAMLNIARAQDERDRQRLRDIHNSSLTQRFKP